MAYIEIKNLNYKYPTAAEKSLVNIDLTIEKGGFCAIIGPNGAGKTTLCNAVRGFVPKFHKGDFTGDVLINGKSLADRSIGEIALQVGFVFQNPFTQISGVKDTVFEEIAFGLENLGIPPKQMRDRVREIISALNLGELEDKKPAELSGGQRQKVALASIIVMEPDILVIDEPTSQLDPEGTEGVFRIISMMKEKGKTIILVEHKIELIAEYADSVVVLKNGGIAMQGPCARILSNTDILREDIPVPQYALIGRGLRENGFAVKEIPITLEQTLLTLKPLFSGDK